MVERESEERWGKQLIAELSRQSGFTFYEGIISA